MMAANPSASAAVRSSPFCNSDQPLRRAWTTSWSRMSRANRWSTQLSSKTRILLRSHLQPEGLTGALLFPVQDGLRLLSGNIRPAFQERLDSVAIVQRVQQGLDWHTRSLEPGRPAKGA